MLKTLPFNEHVAEYEDWFEKYPLVFQSEVEAIRELLPAVKKNGGSLIVGFIEKNSTIGKYYEARKPQSVFYKDANFYTVERINNELKRAGFRDLTYSQTLFHNLDNINTLEPSMPGYGEGSFVIIKSIKR